MNEKKRPSSPGPLSLGPDVPEPPNRDDLDPPSTENVEPPPDGDDPARQGDIPDPG